MRIQLFVPPGGYVAERWSKGSTMPPLGILSIAAVLEREGLELEVVPADVLGLDWAGVERRIRDYEPDLIGVTSATENRFRSFELIRRARRVRPQALTVMGGPHASMAAEDTLAHLSELDAVVRGEGEVTTLDLCRRLEAVAGKGKGAPSPSLSLEGIPGLSWKRDGRVVTNPPRPPIEDLDSLPFPAFHRVPFEKYNFTVDVPGHGALPAVNVMTSRGCPFNCNFCATPVNWGRRVRMRSPKNVLDEIEGLIGRYGSRVIFFYDDTFNVSARRVEEMCDAIRARGLDFFWRAEVRLDLMTKPLLARMKEAGLFHLSFGLEAGSERVRNEVINKKIDLADFHNLIAWCQELDVIPAVFFIFSHPTESWAEARQTIDLIERYRNEIEGTVSILHVYPGTPLEETARKMGILPRDFSWTKRRFSKIITLPMAQGDVPLFVDRLTWSQISELVFRWSFSAGRTSILRKIPRALRHVHSPGDVRRYAVMAWVYARLKLRRLFRSRKSL
jgi:anaerobic magnesium-protoporphyrin IX monomethyl ester cyclase